MVIEVTFKGNRREFFDWPFPEPPAAKTPVIVEAERGEDFGRVHATGDLATARKAGTTHGKASPDPLRKVVRAANGDEIVRAGQLRDDETNVRMRAIEKVRALGLDMKISDTEWQYDKKRLTVYFTAEQRVDFRHLVRQLEGLFGTRVHMWHIGVRDEAKRVDGVGRCGRQLCSASWLPELVPVKSSVAKDQHLSTLNPAQISGACGRLMCCLRYEHEFYVQQRKRFPKEGKVVKTSLGEEKIVSLDIFRETVTLRQMGGEARVLPLVQLQAEMGGAPAAVIETESEPIAEELSEENEAKVVYEAVRDAAPQARPERQPRPERQQRPERQERPDRQQRPERQQRPRQDQQQPRTEQQPRQQQPQRPQQPRPQQPPRPQPEQVEAQAGDTQAQPGDQPRDGAGRRRRRGRRGGRRGRGGPNQGTEHGGQGSGPGSEPQSPDPTPPPSDPTVL